MVNGLTLEELMQIGINNILVCRANGRKLCKNEILLISQFAQTAAADLRLREICIQQEIEKYDDTRGFTLEDSQEDLESEGDRDDNQNA